MTTQQTPPAAPAANKAPDYPVKLSVEFPEQLSRVKTAFRIFMLIPIWIVASIAFLPIASRTTSMLTADMMDTMEDMMGPLAGLTDPNMFPTVFVGTGISVATALMLIFRRKYPRWWFDFQQELTRFLTRLTVYLLLMRDEYPSTDDKQAVTLEYEYPDAAKLHRLLPIVKWLLVIPHLIVLTFLAIGAFLATIFAWFAIIITGKYPSRALFDYMVGVMRWGSRVNAYAFLLTTDRYPPFSLD